MIFLKYKFYKCVNFPTITTGGAFYLYICDMIWSKVGKCEIEIQAKNKEIHKKIDNTNIHNFLTE